MRKIWIPVLLLAGGLWTPVRADEVPADSLQVRAPRGAMVRSLALPGWGQFYNGKRLKGVVIAAAEIGSGVALFVERSQSTEAVATVSDRNTYLFTTIGIILYSMADAYVDAHLDTVDWGTVELDAVNRSVRGVVRVRF